MVGNRLARLLAYYFSVARAIACSLTVTREIALRNKIPAARVLRRLVFEPTLCYAGGLGINAVHRRVSMPAGDPCGFRIRVTREMHRNMNQTDAEFERLSCECPRLRRILNGDGRDRTANRFGPTHRRVPWDWVVINGRMARCINPFVDLPDAADGWKSVEG